MWLCTPPSDRSPSKCRRPPVERTLCRTCASTGFVAKEPSLIARLIRVKSWYTMRPAPRFMWPTSEFPIWLSGSPVSSPDADCKGQGVGLRLLAHAPAVQDDQRDRFHGRGHEIRHCY